jgi:two-component system response regulator FlrC
VGTDVLVVDDEPLVRRTLVEMVQRQGYEAMGVGSGEEALRHLTRTPCRLVLADVRLPGISGQEVLRHVREGFPQVRVVLITGYGSIEMAVRALQDGADDFLVKPFGEERVAEVLERTLQAPAAPPPPKTASLAGIVTESPRMLALLETAERIARSPAPVLIQGESGTGKELLAKEIHLRSPRREKPFVALNCAAVPDSLLESELFGHERGAFTGAIARRMGKFEAAHQGTLLLDEVSETSLLLQAKLLRALQEGELDRIGVDRPIRVDVRVVATTNRDLREELEKGRFRQDLFFRLNVVSLRLPPLRERPEDIPCLARHFVQKHREPCGSEVREVSEAALRCLADHAWPGNIRELENCLQRALLLCPEKVLQPSHLQMDAGLAPPPAATGTRWEAERRLILSTLEHLGGNRTRAAEALGVSVRTIRNRLRDYRQEAAMRAAAPTA